MSQARPEQASRRWQHAVAATEKENQLVSDASAGVASSVLGGARPRATVRPRGVDQTQGPESVPRFYNISYRTRTRNRLWDRHCI